MVYHCNACKFNFQRFGEVTDCPDCGKQDIRYATAEEIAEFLDFQKEFELSGDAGTLERPASREPVPA